LNLNTYQASILTLLFETLPIGHSVEHVDFALKGGSNDRHHIAHARILTGENKVHVVFTLPLRSAKVFLALTEYKMKDVARLLANLTEYERENSLALGIGEVVVTPDQQEQTAELPFAVIVMPIETSKDCAALPTFKEVKGKLTTFQFVVPLTKEEWSVRKQDGYDELIDHFETKGKSILF
jgi:Suppressor of fused protein (SUFU)